MVRGVIILAIGLGLAAPAWAGDKAAHGKPKLVPGGLSLTSPDLSALNAPAEIRTELAGKGNFSVGSVSEQGPRDGLAMGGYATYSADNLRLSSSLTGSESRLSGDVTASYVGLPDTTTALSVGYDRLRGSSFSLNPTSTAAAGIDGPPDRNGGDLSVSLSVTHAVTPSFSLGGFAAATRSDGEQTSPEQAFRLGAGLGLRF